jgi:hypothetical protein
VANELGYSTETHLLTLDLPNSMKNIFLVCLIIFQISALSQTDTTNYITYYTIVNKAKYYEYENKPNLAIPLYLEAFKTVPMVFAFDKFHLARCYAMQQDTSQVKHWLLEAIKGGFFYNYNKETRNDPLFNFIDNTTTAIIAQADAEAFQYFHFKKTDLNKWDDSVNYYFYNDAVFRSSHNKEMAIKKGKKYIDTTLTSWDQLQDKAVNYIIKNGYPGLLRAPFATIFGTVLWHLTPERKALIQPFLYEELKHGNITPVDYAGFCENLEFSEGGADAANLYYVIKTDFVQSDWPILIANRKSIGLSIYLDQSDYIPYQIKRRNKLPWIDQVIAIQ